jgi:hypothetical protein
METTNVRGTPEATPLVAVIEMAVAHLFGEHPGVAYDLVMIARDPDYKPFGTNGDALQQWSLIGPGNDMHESIRNIVLDCTEGEGLEMRFRSRRAKEND